MVYLRKSDFKVVFTGNAFEEQKHETPFVDEPSKKSAVLIAQITTYSLFHS